MTTPDHLIEAVNLRRVFHTAEAVAGICFSAWRGENFGLLGTGGAGKASAGSHARCLPSSWQIHTSTRRGLLGD
jgi:ABC-type oligopeptide transport system ATPase subunit